MDLRDFVTSFDLSGTGVVESLMSKFMGGYRDLMANFQALVTNVAGLDLSETAQVAHKSAFILKMADFISNFNDMLTKFQLDTSIEKPAETVGSFTSDYAVGDDSRSFNLVCIALYDINTWRAKYFESGYDTTWLDGLITSPVNNVTYFIVADHSDPVQFIVRMLTATSTDYNTIDTNFDNPLYLNRVVGYHVAKAITQSRTIPIEVDLLETQFPQVKSLADNVGEVLSAIALST